MKKFIKLACVIMAFLTISLPLLSFASDNYAEETIQNYDPVKYKTSEEIQEFIYSSNPKDTILSFIQLVDNIDFEMINEEVYTTTGISIQTMEEYFETTFETDSKLYLEKEAERYQLMEYKDIYSDTKNRMVREHIYNQIKNIIDKYDLITDEFTFISEYAPCIPRIEISAEQIYAMIEDDEIEYIDVCFDSDAVWEDYGAINPISNVTTKETQSIRGRMAVDEGYKGNGIRVGMIENGCPSSYYSSNVIYVTETHPSSLHSDTVADIIFAMAPECTIYSYYIDTYHPDAPFDENSVYRQMFFGILVALNTLIDSYDLHVINISYGSNGFNAQCNFILNYYVKNTDLVICVAAGNTGLNSKVNALGADNTITVGGVMSNTSGHTINSSFSYYTNSCYLQDIVNSTINKPDICAPAKGYNAAYTGEGTSFACPRVTGAVVQMMSRNPWMIDQPDAIKAAIMASGTFNAGTTKDIIGAGSTSTQLSSKEGAGVLDAGFCLKVAGNGRWIEHTFTATGNWTTNIYADYTSKPLRVAVCWQVRYTNEDPNFDPGNYDDNTYSDCCNYANTKVNPEIDIRLFKDGKSVGSSSAYSNHVTYTTTPELNYNGLCTNYEIIEISPSILTQYGAGYYELKITRRSGFSGTMNVSAAWEQY